MSRKHEEPTVSRHIEIYASDWEFLQQSFGKQSEGKLGPSAAIRQLIRKGVRDYQERTGRKMEFVAPKGVVESAVKLDDFFARQEGRKAK